MSVDKKILQEIYRYKQINTYILEQDAEVPPGVEAPPPVETPPGAEVPPANATGTPPPPEAPSAETTPTQPVDIETDPEVQKVEGDEKEQIEVTDLVKSQKSVEEKQEQYFDSLFSHLTDLESKLSAMDDIIGRLNTIEDKIEKYRVKTPEEKLELRTLDSGPFNQKLTQFFQDKEVEMEESGKNEYVLTSDEVESYSPNEIKRSFRDFSDVEMTPENDVSKFKKIY